MRIKYDPDANAACITLGENKGDLETVEISNGVLVDLNENGTLFGMELLNAKRQLGQTDDGYVVLAAITTGNEVKLRIS